MILPPFVITSVACLVVRNTLRKFTHHALKILGAHLRNRFVGVDASVIHQDVHRSEELLAAFYHILDIFLIGYVRLDGGRFPPLVLEAAHGIFRLSFINISYKHLGARFRQPVGYAIPYALSPARHYGCFTCQTHNFLNRLHS
jgi:hypothetical protein